MQKLIMPFKRQMMLCGYKNAEYLKYWGYPHYGVDISTIQGQGDNDPTVYASGYGVVLSAGWDIKLGGAVCVFLDCVGIERLVSYLYCTSRAGRIMIICRPFYQKTYFCIRRHILQYVEIGKTCVL